MKLRSFFSGLAGVVLVLLLLGAGGYYWLAAQSPLILLKGGGMASPKAAMFVPKQAPAMVSLLVNPDRLDGFRYAVAQPQDRRRARAELAQLKQGFLANTGLDYAQDVQPWLGDELTLAVTTRDVDRDSSNGQQPGYLLAISTQNPQRSREFLQLFWQKRAIAGTDLVFEQYKGVKLIYSGEAEKKVDVQRQTMKSLPEGKSATGSVPTALTQPDFSLGIPTLASAVVGDRFVLFANSPRVLRDAITNVQAPDLSLGNARFYQDSIATLTAPRIGLSFVNLPGLATWVAQESTPPGRRQSGQVSVEPAVISGKSSNSKSPDAKSANAESPDAKLPKAKPTYKTLAIALGLNRQGLTAETALISSDRQTTTVVPPLSRPVGALDYIPASSPFSASGTDLHRLWANLPQATTNAPEATAEDAAATLLRPLLNTLQARWHLDLPQDIFSWVTQEYALASLPAQDSSDRPKSSSKTAQSAVQNLTPDWIFVAQRSPQAEAAIAHLDDLARQQGLSVGPLALGDQTVSAWTRLKSTSLRSSASPLNLQADIQGVHAARDDYEIFTTSLAAMDQALKAVDQSLATDSRFAEATQPLEKPNNGYVYLDWQTSQPLLEQQFPVLKVLELAGQPLFRHLRSLSLSSYGSQNGVQHAGFFLHLRGE